MLSKAVFRNFLTTSRPLCARLTRAMAHVRAIRCQSLFTGYVSSGIPTRAFSTQYSFDNTINEEAEAEEMKKYEAEMTPFISSIEEFITKDLELTSEALEARLRAFQSVEESTEEDLYELLIYVTYYSLENHVASLAGFDFFYSKLRHFLENHTANPKILTTLFFFNQEIFKNTGDNEAMLREEREMNILAVNQVAKNFNQATVLDLGYAFQIAMEGRDQIFKHKFCQKVASRIAQIDVDTYPKQSLR